MSMDFWWLRPSTIRSFSVAVRCTATGDKVELSTSEALAVGVADLGIRDGIVDLTIAGLASGGTWPFTIRVNGATVGSGTGRTYRGNRIRIALGSCMKPTDASPIFDLLRELNPDLFCLLGDLYYENDSVTDLYGESTTPCMTNVSTSKQISIRHTHIRQSMKTPGFLSLIQTTPFFHEIGDHEIWNDIQGSGEALFNSYVSALADPSQATPEDAQEAKAVAVTAYQNYALSSELRCADLGIDTLSTGTGFPNYTRFRAGPVELFALDNYLYRSATIEPDSSNKRILGEQQTTWLVKRIAKSAARWQVLLCPQPFFGVGTNTDTYAPAGPNPGYRYDALDLIWRTRLATNLLFVCGDQHSPAVQYVAPGALDTAYGNQGRIGYPAVLCTCPCPIGRDANTGLTRTYPLGVVQRHTGAFGYSGYLRKEAVRAAEVIDVTLTSASRFMIDGHNSRWWSATMTSGSRVPAYEISQISVTS